MSEIELLPCDVMVAPATIIRKGCPMSTLLLAIRRRKNIDEHLTTWETPPRRSPPQVGRGMEVKGWLWCENVADEMRRYGNVIVYGKKTQDGMQPAILSALSSPPAEEGESRSDHLIRKLCNAAPESPGCIWPNCDCGTGSREERSQADLGESKMEKKR